MIPTSQTKISPKRLTYKNLLTPWCIIRPLPNMQRQIVARCRRRNDADSHLQVLRRLMPTIPFEVVFDITPDELDD